MKYCLLTLVLFFGLNSLFAQKKALYLPEVPVVDLKHWVSIPWEDDADIPHFYGSEEDYCNQFEKYVLEQRKALLASNSADDCGDEPVSVRADLEIKSDWLDAYDYFSVWDAKNLNSYGYDIKQFNKEVPVKLFNEKAMELWSAPIKHTRINSKYGMRRGRWHHGTDLDLEIGDSVYAVFDGIVRMAKVNRGGYGNYVLIRHKNGLETLYGHLDEYFVAEGTEVKAGQLIGAGGNTGRSSGPHLHFEVRYLGHSIDPTHLFDFDEAALLHQDFTITRSHFADYIKSLEAQWHRIRSGDCLSKIAYRYGTSIGRICRLNGISRRTVLRIGRRLRVR